MGLAMADGGEWQVVDRRAKGPERSGGSQAHKATRKSTALSPKEQYGARDPPRVRASSALLSITSRGCAPLGGDANKLCVSPRVACRSAPLPPLCGPRVACLACSGPRYKTEHALLRRKIFVGGIGPLGERDISAFFSKHGEIETVEVLRGRDKQPRGFSFIIFKRAETVDKLVATRFFEIGNRAVEVMLLCLCLLHVALFERGCGNPRTSRLCARLHELTQRSVLSLAWHVRSILCM